MKETMSVFLNVVLLSVLFCGCSGSKIDLGPIETSDLGEESPPLEETASDSRCVFNMDGDLPVKTRPRSLSLDSLLNSPEEDVAATERQEAKSFVVRFDYNSSSLDEAALEIVVDALSSISRAKRVLVEGHCDERGTSEYNFALGMNRAMAVRELLTNLGVDPSIIDTVSYGEDRPEAVGNDEKSWAKNRRVVAMWIETAP